MGVHPTGQDVIAGLEGERGRPALPDEAWSETRNALDPLLA